MRYNLSIERQEDSTQRGITAEPVRKAIYHSRLQACRSLDLLSNISKYFAMFTLRKL